MYPFGCEVLSKCGVSWCHFLLSFGWANCGLWFLPPFSLEGWLLFTVIIVVQFYIFSCWCAKNLPGKRMEHLSHNLKIWTFEQDRHLGIWWELPLLNELYRCGSTLTGMVIFPSLPVPWAKENTVAQGAGSHISGVSCCAFILGLLLLLPQFCLQWKVPFLLPCCFLLHVNSDNMVVWGCFYLYLLQEHHQHVIWGLESCSRFAMVSRTFAVSPQISITSVTGEMPALLCTSLGTRLPSSFIQQYFWVW